MPESSQSNEETKRQSFGSVGGAFVAPSATLKPAAIPIASQISAPASIQPRPPSQVESGSEKSDADKDESKKKPKKDRSKLRKGKWTVSRLLMKGIVYFSGRASRFTHDLSLSFLSRYGSCVSVSFLLGHILPSSSFHLCLVSSTYSRKKKSTPQE